MNISKLIMMKNQKIVLATLSFLYSFKGSAQVEY